MSPDGEAIVTGAGDETLRFWNVFSKMRSTKVFTLFVRSFSFLHVIISPILISVLPLSVSLLLLGVGVSTESFHKDSVVTTPPCTMRDKAGRGIYLCMYQAVNGALSLSIHLGSLQGAPLDRP